MASKTYYFTGIAKWVKNRKPNEWGKYTAQLYLDDQSILSFKESGLGLQLREDDAGQYVQFSREHERKFDSSPDPVVFGPPPIYLPDGTEYKDLVGNGSLATFKVTVYDAGPKRKGHRLESIRVDQLIPYVPTTTPVFGNVPVRN
jgi:hypothetical protein